MSLTQPPRFVSIILPAFNEQTYIGEALSAVLQLDYPRDCFEVIVVDNGSIDDTVSIAKQYADQVHVVPNVRVGAVRNFGVAQAKGEIIAFLDADCLPPTDWLTASLAYMDQQNCDAVGGIGLVRKQPSWVESNWILNQTIVDKPSKILAGAAIVMKKDAFLAVGGFNEQINAGEDTALANELVARGYVVHLAKCCAVIHLGYPQDLGTFIQRQLWQASSYLKSRRRNRVDIIFWMVVAFSLCLLTAPLWFWCSPLIGFLSLIPVFLLPGVLSAKRILMSRFFSWQLYRYFQIYILDFCYLLGRSLGLMKSILTELKVISDKKSHY